MKINKKIGILGVALLLIIAIFFIFNKNDRNVEVIEAVLEEKVFDCDSLDYSRLSLFNSSADRVSLNIPAVWEGNYRLKEAGSRAMFYYLLQDGTANKIFSIDKQNNISEGAELICGAGDSLVALNLYLDETELYYDEIIDGLACIKKSIKCD